MMKSTFLFAPGKMRMLAVASVAFFAFFFLSAGKVAAQSYVTPDEAHVILKGSIETLYAQILNETPGTANYNQLYAKYSYHEAIINHLGSGETVEAAVNNSQDNICYPTNVMDCQGLPDTQKVPIINATKALLTN